MLAVDVQDVEQVFSVLLGGLLLLLREGDSNAGSLDGGLEKGNLVRGKVFAVSLTNRIVRSFAVCVSVCASSHAVPRATNFSVFSMVFTCSQIKLAI